MNKHSTPPISVAIIGAGISGLSCATQLKSLSFQVQVYEKSRGPSGRMSTRNGDGWSADHGAQYFTARDPQFIEELSHWVQAGVAAPWHPNLSVFEANQWKDSSSQVERYVGTPAMNSPGKYLAKNIPIEFNQTINSIAHQNGKWLLSSLEIGNIEQQFDWLILALPAPQAQTLAKSIDPSIQALSANANMQGCWTVMASFSKRPEFPYDAGFVNNEIISWISRNNAKPGRTGLETWTIHANPQWSQEWIELDKAEAAKRILECAKKLGLDTRSSEISVHRWRYASGAIDAGPQFHLNMDLQLGFCGDWLHGGRVEGAWLSGYQLANAIDSKTLLANS